MARRRKKGFDISDFYEYNVNIENRIVYAGSQGTTYEDGETGVDHKMSESVIKGLLTLDMLAPKGDKPIKIVLNSPGGNWSHGIAIYDAIKSCTNSTVTMVFGEAMSMGAVILQASDLRLVSPLSKIMIHYGTSGYYGHPKILEKWAREEKRINKEMEDIFLAQIVKKNPSFRRKDLQKMLNFDTILSAEEAKDLGLCDEIIGVKN